MNRHANQNKNTPPRTEKSKLEEMLHSSLSAAPEGFVAAAVEVGVDVEEAEGEVDDGEVADEAELLKNLVLGSDFRARESDIRWPVAHGSCAKCLNVIIWPWIDNHDHPQSTVWLMKQAEESTGGIGSCKVCSVPRSTRR
jgi:hypothetical protein